MKNNSTAPLNGLNTGNQGLGFEFSGCGKEDLVHGPFLLLSSWVKVPGGLVGTWTVSSFLVLLPRENAGPIALIMVLSRCLHT